MEPAPLEVRAVERADRGAWQPLWDGYNAFYGRSGATALAPEITALTWERLHDPEVPMFGLVACSGGKTVGLVVFIFHLNTTSSAPVCYLEDLFVEETMRGRGVAAALIEGVCERAREAGCHSVYWQTHHTNARAMRLYDRVARRSEFLIYRRVLDGPIQRRR